MVRIGKALFLILPTMILGLSAAAAEEKPVQLSEVPKPAMDAGQAALGAPVSAAKVREQDGKPVYELESKDASGAERSVYVTQDGKLVQESNKDEDDD